MVTATGPILTTAELIPSGVRVRWHAGEVVGFHSLWLRDSCRCAACIDPISGQRLQDLSALPARAAVGVEVLGDALRITWEDGHAGCFPGAWLREQSLHANGGTTAESWTAGIQNALPEHRYEAVTGNERALLAWLSDVDRLGFALLRGVPVKPGTVIRVVDLFGCVRETNYGRLFDVRSVVNPTNLAYTGLALGPHTDNPYREPPPTLQLLHCLSSSVEGGENTLVDGFRVAAALRRRDPDSFDLLTRHPVLYRYEDADTILEREVPIVSLDSLGRVEAIYFNSRSRRPMDLPAPLLGPYHAAYRIFAGMLSGPEYKVRVRLEPGDLLIMDNRRVLHGRTGFSATGERHLQGCYADIDGLRSRLAVLRRRQAFIDEIFERFRERGDGAYIGEPVSQTEHMLQAAFAAQQDGAGPTLIAAALLHDFGHLAHDLPEDSAEHGVDTRHEDIGFAVLAGHFPPAVLEPIRLHVAAKRYLCAVEPAYLDALSPASTLSLELQGGPMSPAEVEEFERNPHYENAVRLRRYDDLAKIPGLETPPLEAYQGILEIVLVR